MLFRPTEKWTLDDENFSGEKLGPNLDHYAFYPEIFVVPSDFCASNTYDENTVLSTKDSHLQRIRL